PERHFDRVWWILKESPSLLQPGATMSFILLGPAGSGKGTLARTLAQRHGIQIFETGAALRAVAQQDPELARLLAGGNMAPASLVMRLLDDAFQANPGGRLVLDGVPRN